MIRFVVAIALASAALAGCGQEQVPYDGQTDDKADNGDDDLSVELTEKYGLRPRRYAGFFNGSNEAEERFLAHLPGVTDELNARGLELGYDLQLSDADLALNFISEGGFYLLDQNFTDSDYDNELYIDGYNYLGVDTFGDNIDNLGPWLTEEIIRAINDGEILTFETVNELGETVTSIVVQTLEQGLEVNALVYAWSRSRFMDDLAAEEIATTFPDLSRDAQFFWSTMYYNAGVGFGRDRLREEGPDYWTVKWTAPDDHETMSRYARYNALWRTSSFEYLRRTTLANE